MLGLPFPIQRSRRATVERAGRPHCGLHDLRGRGLAKRKGKSHMKRSIVLAPALAITLAGATGAHAFTDPCAAYDIDSPQWSACSDAEAQRKQCRDDHPPRIGWTKQQLYAISCWAKTNVIGANHTVTSTTMHDQLVYPDIGDGTVYLYFDNNSLVAIELRR
jgi:hypothetical protein